LSWSVINAVSAKVFEVVPVSASSCGVRQVAVREQAWSHRSKVAHRTCANMASVKLPALQDAEMTFAKLPESKAVG
jgi:hypothetical protein